MDISAQNPESSRDLIDPLDRLLRAPSKPRWWPTAFERLMAKPAGGDGHRPANLVQLRRRTAAVVGLLTAVGMSLVVVVGGAGSRPAAVSLPRAGSAPSGVTVPSPSPSPSAGAASGNAASGTGSATGTRTGSDNAGDGTPTAAAVRSSVTVHVAGAVAIPGLVHVGAGGRVADALAAAGGPRPDADLDRLNLAAPLVDGVRVYVPLVGQPEPAAVDAAMSGGGGLQASPRAEVPTAPIDINAADAAALDALPGVGPSTANAIVAYRSEHGRFENVDELQEVRGIGPAKFEALQDLVVVG